MLNDGRDKD